MVATNGLIRLCAALLVFAAAAPAALGCGLDRLGTSRTLVVGTQDGPRLGLKSYPRILPLAGHEVVLTFDDGPAETTPLILNALMAECVKATFFLVGAHAEAFPIIVKRERFEVHTIGHHTYSHLERTLRQMSFAAARADIDRGILADETTAYDAASDAPRVPFFRFPGFADTSALDTWLASRNVAVFGTDIWAYDWLDLAPEQELDILMRQLDKAKRGIILLHDTRPSTAQMLPALLHTLKVGGYRVVHIVPGPGQVETVSAPEGWHSETDKIIAAVFARRHLQLARAMRPVSSGRPWALRTGPRRTNVFARRALLTPPNVWRGQR